MIERLKNIYLHPKSTLEGTTYGVAIVAAGLYAFQSFHCSVPANFDMLVWASGGYAFIRGAMAGGSPRLQEVKPA
jgi:hypothetical protein